MNLFQIFPPLWKHTNAGKVYNITSSSFTNNNDPNTGNACLIISHIKKNNFFIFLKKDIVPIRKVLQTMRYSTQHTQRPSNFSKKNRRGNRCNLFLEISLKFHTWAIMKGKGFNCNTKSRDSELCAAKLPSAKTA